MKRKYISNMPIEGFSKYHICKNLGYPLNYFIVF